MNKLKTGIFVDSENIRACGGFGMRYDALREYVGRSGIILRANSYLAEDRERMSTDRAYRNKTTNFYNIIRSNEFKIIKKYAQHFTDSAGNVTTKANADMELAIDAILQARNLDRVVLLTGDGDFTRLVEALQNMGIRVEIISFRHTNKGLMNAADFYMSGYLIPNLLPIKNPIPGETVYRGIVTQLEKGYGFFKYYEYNSDGELKCDFIFFHFSDLKCHQDNINQKDAVFEFTKQKSTKNGHEFKAVNIVRIDNE